MAGTAAMAGAFSAAQPPADEPLALAATPTPIPTPTPVPDLLTVDGLTLKVDRIQLDDTKTVIDIALEGRPELGRFGSPAINGFPNSLKLTDDKGVQFNVRSFGGKEGQPRFVRLSFDPVPAGLQLPAGESQPMVRAPITVRRMPPDSDELAFATVAELSELVRTRQVTSTQLTRMYLARLRRWANG